MTFSHALSTNNYGTAKIIVATSAANGSHVTLASAMAVAVSGDTIFMRDSVTENVTVTPGVNISSWPGASDTPTVSITGTLTFSSAGSYAVSNVRLTTNSATVVTVSGSGSVQLVFNNIYFNCTNNTGISYTNSNAASQIFIRECEGDIGTTGITLFASSSTGRLQFANSRFTNSGGTSTASTNSAGVLDGSSTSFTFPITNSSTGTFGMIDFVISTSAQNATSFTTTASTTSSALNANLASGSASCVSIGTGSTLILSESFVNSSNTNAITGLGTLSYSFLNFPGASSGINTTTKTPIALNAFRNPTQPSFLAYLGANADNVTGAGAAYTLGTAALTEVFDNANNFNTNGTFTAPVTGRYYLQGKVHVTGCTIASVCQVDIVTTARTYTNYFNRAAGNQDFDVSTAAICDMTEGNTATVVVTCSGEAGNTDDVFGTTSPWTYFTGYLVC